MTRTRKPTAAQKRMESDLTRGFLAGWKMRYRPNGGTWPSRHKALKAFLDRERKRR